jgi:quercetin dioxygenase-like cupin family protein
VCGICPGKKSKEVSAMKITSLEKVEMNSLAMEGAKDVYKQIPISRSDGTPFFSFRVFTIEPGGHTPYHKHRFEHLNYIIEGTGLVAAEGGEERPIKKGDFLLILPDEVHQFRNSSLEEPLKLICGVPKEYE